MSPMTSWFPARCLGRCRRAQLLIILSDPNVPQRLKIQPLILGMQTLRLRENRSVTPKPHKSETGRASLGIANHVVLLQCPLSSSHSAAWQIPWAMRSEEGTPESPCDFFAV